MTREQLFPPVARAWTRAELQRRNTMVHGTAAKMGCSTDESHSGEYVFGLSLAEIARRAGITPAATSAAVGATVEVDSDASSDDDGGSDDGDPELPGAAPACGAELEVL